MRFFGEIAKGECRGVFAAGGRYNARINGQLPEASMALSFLVIGVLAILVLIIAVVIIVAAAAGSGRSREDR